MPYASEISRTNPTCFLFLVDFVFNADLVSVVRFLDIGTRVSQGVR